ncbi:hypothetical protein KY334_01980 [Candidatus Woesearchaeota archaeon]|nr:hypothetical protein [Candidatus Woesearchaeota archaeon]
MYEYKGIVHRVVDGDTMEIDVDLGFQVYTRITFRILELDTYETRLIGETTEADKKKGLAIKQFVTEILNDKEVEIETFMKKGFYKRYLCHLRFKYDDKWISYNTLMFALGCNKKANEILERNDMTIDHTIISPDYKKLHERYKEILKEHGILE